MGLGCIVYILLGEQSDLEETKMLISCSAPRTNVHVVVGDIGNLDSLPSLCSKLFETVNTSSTSWDF